MSNTIYSIKVSLKTRWVRKQNHWSPAMISIHLLSDCTTAIQTWKVFNFFFIVVVVNLFQVCIIVLLCMSPASGAQRSNSWLRCYFLSSCGVSWGYGEDISYTNVSKKMCCLIMTMRALVGTQGGAVGHFHRRAGCSRRSKRRGRERRAWPDSQSAAHRARRLWRKTGGVSLMTGI